MLFEEKDRLLSFSFIYNSDPNNVKDIQGYLVNNYDIILFFFSLFIIINFNMYFTTFILFLIDIPY